MVKVRGASRSFLCKNNLKTVAFEFTLFADDYSRVGRSDSDGDSARGFRIEDFQERLYGVDEFWDLRGQSDARLNPAKQPLMCPAGPRVLRRVAGAKCSDNAVGPASNVSTGFNLRLHQSPEMVVNDPANSSLLLTSRILEQPRVPLVFDVDGAAAARHGVVPFYSAPQLFDLTAYPGDRFWFPALRHGGKLNAAFVGGYVLASRQPNRDSAWDWRHQPNPNPE